MRSSFVTIRKQILSQLLRGICFKIRKCAQCLKITEKVSFNIASRSELHLHFEWTKVNQKYQKWSILSSFWKPEAYGQIVLPDRSLLKGRKSVEKAKIEKFKCDIFGDF